MARRRAVGVCDAQGPAVRDRRRAPVRVPVAVRRLSSVPDSAGARRQLRPGAGADRRADGAPAADRRRAAAAAAAASRPQLPAGRRHDRPAARRRRARMSGSSCGRPASRRSPTSCTSPSSRGSTKRRGGISFRGFIDELQRAAQSTEARRSADSRGGQRRRAADDGAQGQGPRVPCRHPRGSDVPDEPQRRQPVSRCRTAVSARSGSADGRRTNCTITKPKKSRATRRKAFGSRTSRRRARAICSSCRRVGDEPWDGGWLSSAEPRAVSAGRRAARRRRAGRSVRRSNRRTRCCSGRTTNRRGRDRLSRASTHFAGGYSVVWWDPSALTLGLKPRSACGART